MKKKIGLLFGGRSGEHEVSLVSAGNIAKSFDKNLFEVIPLFISRSGHWYGPIPMDEIATAKEEQYQDQQVVLLPQPGGILCDAKDGHEICRLDGIFPIVHGTYGEDGVTQGLLELVDIPYAGAGVTGSALCMDKVVMRKVLAYHHIPQVRFTTVLRSQVERDINKAIAIVEATLAYPVFIKPANGGSSVGINKAKDRAELVDALRIAAKYDRKILVEQGVTVREIEVAVMGNEAPLVSQPGEICSSNEFYDYKAKYIDNKSVAVIPADLPQDIITQIRQLAAETYLALECEGFARVDFFVEEGTDKVYLNEVNSLPGFTDISMFPKMWEQAGISTTDLLTQLMFYAEARHTDRKKNSIDC